MNKNMPKLKVSHLKIARNSISTAGQVIKILNKASFVATV